MLMNLRLQLAMLLLKCGEGNIRATSRFTGRRPDMKLVKRNMAVAKKKDISSQ